MLRINRKPFIFGLGAIFCLCFLLFSNKPAQALSTKIKQVRTKDNPAVYFLYHAGHRKKAYFNADTYLSYGNKWSDVKVVSANELNSWPDAKLIKKTDSPAIYYIKGNQKALIVSWTDLQDFALDHEPIVTVNQTDLDQYADANYETIGLKRSGNILVFNDLVTGANANTILTNTDGNLMSVFRFRSPASVATITSVTLNFGGVSSSQILKSVFVLDENSASYNANVNLSANKRQVVINFRDPIVLNPGDEKTVKVFLNLDACACNNQTLSVEFRQAADISSTLTPVATFPLRGTQFKILDGTTILGQVKSQETTISSGGQTVGSGSRLIGKFTLTEESGREDALIKDLVFRNGGSASVNDWEDFRLFNNDQIISRTSVVNTNGNIDFSINYLRIAKGSPANLTVVASLKTDYNPQATVNLNLSSIWAVGKTYNSSLSPQINNIDESFTLN